VSAVEEVSYGASRGLVSALIVVIGLSSGLLACSGDARQEADGSQERVALVEVKVLESPYLSAEVGQVTALHLRGDALYVLDGVLRVIHQVKVSEEGDGAGDIFLRNGQGPTEVSSAYGSVAAYRGDSMLVADPAARRLLVVAPDRSTRVVPLEGDWAPRPGSSFFPLPSGDVLEVVAGGTAWTGVVHRAAGGQVLDTLVTLPFQAPPAVVDGQPVFRILPPGVIQVPHEGRGLLLGVGAEQTLVWIDAKTLEVRQLDVDLPRRAPDAGMNAAMSALWQERSTLSDIPLNLRSRIRPILPDSLSVYTGLIRMEDRFLVQGPPSELTLDDLTGGAQWGTGGVDWWVLGAAGDVEARFRTDRRFRPLAVRGDTVVGVIPGGVSGARPAILELAEVRAHIQRR